MTVVKEKPHIGREIKDYIQLFSAATLAAYSLESILIPNGIMDGGVVGIAIIVQELTGLSLSMLIFLLNLPFIVLSYKRIGLKFAFKTMFGVASLSVMVIQFHHVERVFDTTILAVVFGGILLGTAIGLAMRANGTLDGTEALAVVLSEKLPFNVDDIILIVNIFIFAVAAYVFDIEKAGYSLISYFIAATAINVVLKGFSTQKKIAVITTKYEDIMDTLLLQYNITSTHYVGTGAVSKENKDKVEIIINRLEEAKVTALIKDIDPDSFFSITDVSHVHGGRFKTKSH